MAQKKIWKDNWDDFTRDEKLKYIAYNQDNDFVGIIYMFLIICMVIFFVLLDLGRIFSFIISSSILIFVMVVFYLNNKLEQKIKKRFKL